jgi:hypothetical protein
MQTTQAFPPVNALLAIDYKKHLNSFIDAVVIITAFVAAIASVTAEKWVEYDMSTRLQFALLTLKEWAIKGYQWSRTVAFPAIKKFSGQVYQTGVNVRQFYDMINSPLFITL